MGIIIRDGDIARSCFTYSLFAWQLLVLVRVIGVVRGLFETNTNQKLLPERKSIEYVEHRAFD